MTNFQEAWCARLNMFVVDSVVAFGFALTRSNFEASSEKSLICELFVQVGCEQPCNLVMTCREYARPQSLRLFSRFFEDLIESHNLLVGFFETRLQAAGRSLYMQCLLERYRVVCLICNLPETIDQQNAQVICEQSSGYGAVECDIGEIGCSDDYADDTFMRAREALAFG